MKLYALTISTCLLCLGTICADGDIDQQNISSEKINQPAQGAGNKPFSFETHFDYISPAKITTGFYEGDKVHFAEAKVEATAIVYYDPTYTEGISLSLGFEPTYLHWDQNPYFHQDHFNLLPISITGFTKRIDEWFWRTQFTANFDVEEWSSDYTTYDLLLWGRYALQENLGIHFGFWLETGLRMNRIYPIFGVDWKISKNWLLNLIFPFNISINYYLTPQWILSIASRNFDSRFRVHKDDYLVKSLIRYTNVGAECALRYETQTVSANIHAGAAIAGKLRLADHKNHHAKNYKLDTSLYAGFELEVKF